MVIRKRILAAAAAVVIAAGAHQAAHSPTSPSLASDVGGSKPALKAHGAWEPFCEHRFVTPVQVPADPNQLWSTCKPTEPIQFLIASVPDPEQTHLSLDFDRYVESITWAVSVSRFSLEDYWFPWRSLPEKEESDPTKRAALEQDRESRLQMPGVLLFHRNLEHGQGQELLAVFLIGERPTFGVNQVALHKALIAMQALVPKSVPSPQPIQYERIYMIGPSFSGSLVSLGPLLASGNLWEGLNGRKKPFTIISGQATSTAELESFHPADGSTLMTTVHDDRYAVSSFLAYAPLASFGTTPDMVLLSEDETGYGNSLQLEKLGNRVLSVRYPRGIARLRNAATEIPDSATDQGAKSRQTALDVPLILKETGEDVIRSFSQQQTPLSSEAVLINIAGMIRRNRIQYAGILATDPLDTLFLIRFLHVACPDVQLVAFSSDLLYAHISHKWAIEGLLTVSTYPLFIENQEFTRPEVPPVRAAFASAYQEGVYNATRQILNLMQVDKPAQSDKANGGKLLEFASPITKSRSTPPLWLTLLGHDSFWPVALLDGTTSAQQPCKTVLIAGPPDEIGDRSLPEHPSLLWQTVFAAVAGYSVFVIAIVLLLNTGFFPGVKGWLRGVAFIRNFALSLTGLQVGAQATNLYIIVMTVAITNLLFWLTLHPLSSMNHLELFCTFLAVCAFAEGIWMTWRVVASEPKWDVLSLIIFCWCFTLTCGIALLYTASGCMTEAHTMAMFAYRALHPESGVSPILPALILAFGYQYWSLLQLRRMRWIEERRPYIQLHPCVCNTNQQTARHLRDVKPPFVEPPPLQENEIETVFGGRTAIVALPFMAIWLLLFWPPTHVNSIEPFSYFFFFSTLLVVMYGMLIGNWIRFIFLWKDFSQMLRQLENHPIREAFSRLPGDFAWGSIWIGSLRPQRITFTRSYEYLLGLASRRIYLLSHAQMASLPGNLKIVEEESQTGAGRYGLPYFEAFGKVERDFACAAYEAAIRLEEIWSKGHSDSLPAPDPKSAAALPSDIQDQWALEEFLAIRYVAYIRYVLQQMRNFLEFVTAAFMLLAVASVAYPFQGHHSIATAHLLLFGVLGTGVFMAFLRMDRDPLLSRLSDSKPNQVGLDFVWRILSYGSIPLLSLIGSQFPSVREFLFSWVQPALQAIK